MLSRDGGKLPTVDLSTSTEEVLFGCMNELSRDTHHSGERSGAKHWSLIYPKTMVADSSSPFIDTFEENKIIT